jgi:signal transduction histidine kinase
MRPFGNLSLRGRFLALVVLGVILPLGIVGMWGSFSARRSGIQLVRAELEESLAETVETFGQQWVQRLSELLDVADARAVVGALSVGPSLPDLPPGPERAELLEVWVEIADFVASVDIRTEAGLLVGRLPDDLGPEARVSTRSIGFLDYEIPARERLTGETLGKLDVRFRIDGLLPPGFLTLGVGGSVPAVFDSRTGTPLAPLPVDATRFGAAEFEWRGEEWVTANRILGDPPLRFAMAAPIGPVTAPFRQAARRGALALLLVVVVSFGLATLFARRLTRPLEELSRAASAVAGGDLDARAEERGPPAVRDTARSFNAMSATLSRTLSQLSRREAAAAVGEFAASLAHEVRNPLTSIRMDLERSQRKLDRDQKAARVLIQRAITEVDRLNASVSDFLRVARSGDVNLSVIHLRVPLEAALRAAEPRCAEARCRLEYDASRDPILVRGDESALERLVLNLILNAAESVDPGTRVGLTAKEKDGLITVSVWDHGPGIAEEARDRIFEPFYTTKEHGTGLGLAIAQRIARAHGSELELDSAREGGALFRFVLPAAST